MQFQQRMDNPNRNRRFQRHIVQLKQKLNDLISLADQVLTAISFGELLIKIWQNKRIILNVLWLIASWFL